MNKREKHKLGTLLPLLLIPLALGVLVLIGIMVLVPHPGAPAGTPVQIPAAAFYVDEDGMPIRRNESALGVSGLQLSFDDGRGSSGTVVTAAAPDGSPIGVVLDMLVGRTYTITASFNGSSLSTEASIRAYRTGYFRQGTIGEGSISVRVSMGDSQLRMIYYAHAALA